MSQKVQNLLVPGGLGFIGSHTVIQIFKRTQTNIIIVDDLSNCFPDVLQRMKKILKQNSTAEQIQKRLEVHNVNILDLSALDTLFNKKVQQNKRIDGIMHFAAKKAIGESMTQPILYFQNNLVGSMNLFKMMQKYNCHHFVFSSTAGVYGDRDNCTETDSKHPLSPYGESKLCVEMLLNSLANQHKKQGWKIISLRYFNPCGGHPSGLLGDEPISHPNNLFPYIQQVLTNKRPQLTVFGSDYPTPDGTCIRDYIHIEDLANAHVLALNKISQINVPYQIYNLGSGQGYSVLEVLKGFQQVLGKPVKFVLGARREGDVSKLVANSQKAQKQLGWKVTKSLKQMCEDSVHFIFKRYNLKEYSPM